ncbi:MAG TPA: DUF4129 domain-containing protein [Anaerolineae bacterium]|nr:DUF4129 domain-containing protein [Anaerolineae bacterium]HQI83667.1 DUF4129 domain-containing protein [Anaerolineae bacterium]
MLLADRRMALVHVSLAGMEALWFAPLFLIFWHDSALSLFAALGWLLAGALLWTLVVEAAGWLFKDSPAYRWSILGVFVVSTLVLIQSVVYPRAPLGGFDWLLATLRNLPLLDGGVRPETVLLLTNICLWLRASYATRRNLTSVGVMGSFKTGFLLLALTAGVWSSFAGRPAPLGYAPLYMGLGLVALTLARSDERAAWAQVEGRRLPLGRLAQFLALVGGFVVIAVLLSRILPQPLNAVLKWVVFALEMGVVVFQLLFMVMVILGAQLGQWLGAKLGIKILDTESAAPSSQQLIDELQRRLEETVGRDIVLAPWAVTFLRYLPLLVLLVGLGVIFWVTVRRARRRYWRGGAELETHAPFAPGQWLKRTAAQLRDIANMAQRFGVGRELLAAISVQNIYANVGRIAARRGHPRPPAMPPDVYLPILKDVFAGCDEALTRITLAYMQVHYGDHPISARDLARLQLDYHTIRASRSE